MTREQLINEAVAKALGWTLYKTFDDGDNIWCVNGSENHQIVIGGWGYSFIRDEDAIYRRLFPEIEKRGLWEEFWKFIPCATPILIGLHESAKGTRELALATPLQICKAFLRVTGGWTEEMEAK